MSEWQAQYNALMRQQCTPCHGQGHLDDAQLGDTFFSTWPCPTCGGSGFAPQAVQHQRPSEIDDVVNSG